MAAQTARIHLTPDGRGSIEIDGQRITGVRAIRIGASVGTLALLTLDVVVHELTLDDGTVEVRVPDKTADSLRALGWTPPAS